MDPTQTLQEMIEAARNKQRVTYYDLATELYTWLRNGGFEPEQVFEYNTVKYPEDAYERGE